MKLLPIAILCFWWTTAFSQCRESDTIDKYSVSQAFVQALVADNIAIGIDTAAAKKQYRHLVPYLSHFWNPHIVQYINLEYLCTGEGIATVAYSKTDDHPHIVRYCKTFPKNTSDDTLLRYVDDRFTHESTRSESPRCFYNWLISDHYIKHGGRYYLVSLWISSHPRAGFDPQLQIQVIDNTFFVEKQIKCLNSSGKSR